MRLHGWVARLSLLVTHCPFNASAWYVMFLFFCLFLFYFILIGLSSTTYRRIQATACCRTVEAVGKSTSAAAGFHCRTRLTTPTCIHKTFRFDRAHARSSTGNKCTVLRISMRAVLVASRKTNPAVYIAITYGNVSHHSGPGHPVTRPGRLSSLGPFRLLRAVPKVVDAPDAAIESIMRGSRSLDPTVHTDSRLTSGYHTIVPGSVKRSCQLRPHTPG